MTSTEFEVLGMTCGGCEKSVVRCIEAIPHVGSVAIDRAANKAAVMWTDGATAGDQQTASLQICQAVEDAGFDCRPI